MRRTRHTAAPSVVVKNEDRLPKLAPAVRAEQTPAAPVARNPC